VTAVNSAAKRINVRKQVRLIRQIPSDRVLNLLVPWASREKGIAGRTGTARMRLVPVQVRDREGLLLHIRTNTSKHFQTDSTASAPLYQIFLDNSNGCQVLSGGEGGFAGL